MSNWWRKYAEQLNANPSLKGPWKRRAAVTQDKTAGRGGWAKRQAPKEMPAPWTRQIAEELIYGPHGPWMRRAVQGTPPYDPDALAFFARLTTQPTTARKNLYNNLIVSLKTAGVWTKLDALYILAAADAQAARQNLVANAYNLTAVNVPVFTVDRGYTGDGSGAYLDTGMDPTTAPSPKLTRDSAHVSSWARNNVASDTAIDIGLSASALTYIRPLRSSTQVARGIANFSAVADFALPSATSVGDTLISRPSSASLAGYRNGALLGTQAATSAALVSSTLRLLTGNSGNYSTRQIASATIGGGLSDAEALALYSARNTFLAAVGAV